ncbi:MAG TPA: HEAT repeat domain-containing protein [Thermoanaerobaculia bacterium]
MWVAIGTALFSFLVGGAATWSGLLHNRRRLQTWREAVAACGLELVEISSYRALRIGLKARAGPLEVRIQDSRRKDYSAYAVVVFPGPPGFSGVRLRPEEDRPLRRAREIEIGDPSFDDAFFVEGPMRLLCALLDEPARRLLVSANAESRLEIVSGEIRAEMKEPASEILPLLVDVGRRFAQPMDAPRRLAENARWDPQPGVRLKNLLLLARELPGDPLTVEVLRAACSDESPEIRLRAARELGAAGRDVLLELAEGAVSDALSAQAVSSLRGELPFERARAILIHSLRRRRLRTARACLESLGRGGAEAVDTLAKVVMREKGELAVAAAQALGSTGSPGAEPPLILALRREPQDLQAAAANALGRVGSAAAVLPLKELAERSPRDPEILRATRQAIAGIQSRLPGASPGQLSLAGDEVGQLSLAQAEAGQLSLANDPAGQLSLPSAEPGQLSLGDDKES